MILRPKSKSFNFVKKALYLNQVFSYLRPENYTNNYLALEFSYFVASSISIFNNYEVVEQLVAAYIGAMEIVNDNGTLKLRGDYPQGGVISSTSGFTLSWSYPTQRQDETALGDVAIEAAEIWVLNGSAFEYYDEVAYPATSYGNLPSGEYAYRFRWIENGWTGYTELSDPFKTDDYYLDPTATVFDDTVTKAEVIAAFSTAQPGDRIYFRGNGGAYTFDWGAYGSGFTISQSGTADNPIIISGYPGDPLPRFIGPGSDALYATAESNNWNWPDGGTSHTQILFNLTGSFVELRHMEVSWAERFNIAIANDSNRLFNVRSFGAWYNNLAIGYGIGSFGSVDDLQFEYIDTAYSRHGPCLSLTHESSPGPTDSNSYDNIQFSYVLAYGAGRSDVDRAVAGLVTGLDGGAAGGNADIFGSFKTLNRNDPSNSLTSSLGTNISINWLYAFGGADNQIDCSPGANYLINNGHAGNLRSITGGDDTGSWGHKSYLQSDGKLSFLSCTAWATNVGTGRGFVPLLEAAQTEIDVICCSGYDIAGDVFHMNGVDSAGLSPATARFIGNTQIGCGSLATIVQANYTYLTNIESGLGASDINDYLYDFDWPDVAFPNMAPKERFEAFRNLHSSKFSPLSTGSLIGNVGLTSAHCATAADDPINPSDPRDRLKVKWFARQTGVEINASTTGGVPYRALPTPIGSMNYTEPGIMGEMIGPAKEANVIGGYGGTVVEVTNTNDSGAGSLRQAFIDATGPIWVVYSPGLTGTITLSTPIYPNYRCTIDNRGANVLIAGAGIIFQNDVDDYIFLYQKFANSSNDAISVDCNAGKGKGWIYQCGFDQAVDECIGISNDNTGITIGWCDIANQVGDGYGILAGGADGGTIDMEILVHHSHLNTYDRQPFGRRVKMHVLNCFHEGWNYDGGAVKVGYMGEIYYENNVADANGGSLAATSQHSGTPLGKLKSVGPHYLLNGAVVYEFDPTNVFTPTYAYTADTADASLKALIESDAGWQDVAHPGTTAPWSV